MSGEAKRLNVVLCWHMHQPDYRGPDHSDYQLPWVYLHGAKDYSDMVAHIEGQPDARAVVNFAPVLLEQLADYGLQIGDWLRHGKRIGDPLLSALAEPRMPKGRRDRSELLKACLRVNEKHIVNRFPMLRKLVDLAKTAAADKHLFTYLNDQFLADLLVWYHLGWMGESVRSQDPRIQRLEEKGHDFDAADRRTLVEVIGDVIGGLIDRYGKLARDGRIELSVTPYAHPIVPLLIDLGTAREAVPEMLMPELTEYPGGETRARWHVRRGVATFKRHFGIRPHGCWPSEGALCEDTARILQEEGFAWAASGQQVLHNSLMVSNRGQPLHQPWLHTPYRVREGSLNCFFRDDGLSDLIGFTYSDWHADDAVANLLQHLENIAEANVEKPDAVVSIIMDGENAWEYYPHNGNYFLPALYRALIEHPKLNLTTFSDFLGSAEGVAPSLDRLVAGSWVYGTLSTWIGDPDKNRAWDMLGEAKATYDRVIASGRLGKEARRAAEMQLSTCEGSDWFWWFGDYNPADTVSDFERLFRHQLSHLYALLGEKPPKYLREVFAHGTGTPEMGGVMKRS